MLRDLIESGVIIVTHLSQVFRQAAGSAISLAAADINAGRVPALTFLGRNQPFVESDLYCVYKEDAEDQAKAAVWCATTFCRRLGFNPLKDCIVLAPMNKGPAGVGNLNMLLQKELNPNPIKYVDRGNGERWGIGDRMIQCSNNYQIGVTNGEIGLITNIEFDDGSLSLLEVDFDGVTVKYTDGDWNDLKLAYAMTIHKVQGSEIPMMVLLHTSHFVLLQRTLLYTGLTRGKRKEVLCVHPQALTTAIQNNKIARRNTMLSERLVANMRSAA